MENRQQACGIAVLLAAALSVSPVFAEEPQQVVPASPVPVASAQPSAFLNAPAYDVERISVPGGGETKSKVGDRIALKVTGLSQPGLVLDPEADAASLSEVGVLIGAVPPDQAGGELHFFATPLKAGELSVPSLPVKDASGVVVARTNPFTLSAVSAIRPDDPKPDQPADLAPPATLKFPWWVVAIGGVLLLALLAAGAYTIIRWIRKRRVLKAAPPEPPRPEDEVALRALEELDRQGLLQKGEFKKHYFRVSEILKVYIGARYRFDAPECTTRELMDALDSRKNIPESVLDEFEVLFEKLDRVKFTDHIPESGEPARITSSARKIVQETRRPPAVVATIPGEERR